MVQILKELAQRGSLTKVQLVFNDLFETLFLSLASRSGDFPYIIAIYSMVCWKPAVPTFETMKMCQL
jgi:hypothetical protein